METVFSLGAFIIAGLLAEVWKMRGRHGRYDWKRSVRNSTKLMPHALTILIMVSHASEITRVVSHVELTDLALSAGLFGLWILGLGKAQEEI